MSYQLKSERVHEIVMDCLPKEGELTNEQIDAFKSGKAPEGWLKVDGVMMRVGLNKARVESHKVEICQMLNQLPVEFHEKRGGGWSFLNACQTSNGEQWGEHRDVDSLVILGIATGAAQLCLPRELWRQLPGGMPYFYVVTDGGIA